MDRGIVPGHLVQPRAAERRRLEGVSVILGEAWGQLVLTSGLAQDSQLERANAAIVRELQRSNPAFVHIYESWVCKQRIHPDSDTLVGLLMVFGPPLGPPYLDPETASMIREMLEDTGRGNGAYDVDYPTVSLIKVTTARRFDSIAQAVSGENDAPWPEGPFPSGEPGVEQDS